MLDSNSTDYLRVKVSEVTSSAAAAIGVTPPWIDAGIGCILFVLLNAACKELTFLAFPTPQADILAGRLLAIVAFAVVQELAFVPTSRWLRLDPPNKPDANPFFQSGSPLAGITFAFIFAVPVCTLATLLGIDWLPEPRPWPAADGALLFLLVAPLSEELFFRAWLLTAFTEAGGSQGAALLASTALFGLYHVPLSTALQPDGSSALLLYEMFGAYLSFLYQRSGGSLPLAALTHSTCNAIVLGLRAAQVGSVLPFAGLL